MDSPLQNGGFQIKKKRSSHQTPNRNQNPRDLDVGQLSTMLMEKTRSLRSLRDSGQLV